MLPLLCLGALNLSVPARAGEDIERGLGHIPFDFDAPFTTTKAAKMFGPLPDRFDWREHGVVTPVEDQGSCGCCYAFTSLDNFESKVLTDGGGLHNFSDNNAKECPAGGYKCQGGAYWITANHFATHGTVLETCDPYSESITGCKPTCPYIKTLLEWRVISETPIASTEVLKSYIMAYGPIYSALNAGNGISWPREFRTYDGSYTLFYTGPGDADHAALIVGWDDSLSHAGGKGAWIAKNSWGSSWGGPCGYGDEGGYYTIAYGSAKIGSGASFLYEWQDYDPRDMLLHHDEAGVKAITGFPPSLEAWELCKYVPAEDYQVERVEFWTFDAVTDADFYLYDGFDGDTFSGLIMSLPDMSFDNPGYHSVRPASQTLLHQDDDVYAVLKLQNASTDEPLTYDTWDPKAPGACYVSPDGVSWTQFTLGDLGVRLRVTTDFDVEGPQIDLWLEPGDPTAGTVLIGARLSEAISDTSLQVTARGEKVNMVAADDAPMVYRGTYRVSGAGLLPLEARARDLLGNPGHAAVDFQVSIVLRDDGGSAVSEDQGFAAAIRRQAFDADSILVFISEVAPGEGVMAAYRVYPGRPPGSAGFRDYVEISIGYNGTPADPEHLCLARLAGDGPEVEMLLDSFIDEERHRVVAYVDSLGLFGLLRRDDVTSPPIRTSGVGIGPGFPNPFSDVTSIRYEVSQAGSVTISIFDVRGRFLRTLYDGEVDRGLHRAGWDGTDARGTKAGPGVYYLKIESRGTTSSAKVVKVN